MLMFLMTEVLLGDSEVLYDWASVSRLLVADVKFDTAVESVVVSKLDIERFWSARRGVSRDWAYEWARKFRRGFPAILTAMRPHRRVIARCFLVEVVSIICKFPN